MKGGQGRGSRDLQYILILRFHSFCSFDAVGASWPASGVGGVGAFHVGGTYER